MSDLGGDTGVGEDSGQRPDPRRLVTFIEESCTDNLVEIRNASDPNWAEASNRGDFRTIVTMYAAACAAFENHADHMFSEWLKGARLLDVDVTETSIFYFMVNRRFSHLAQVRCYLDYKLKLTLVTPEVRETMMPAALRLLGPEMVDAFFPTPAKPFRPEVRE